MLDTHPWQGQADLQWSHDQQGHDLNCPCCNRKWRLVLFTTRDPFMLFVSVAEWEFIHIQVCLVYECPNSHCVSFQIIVLSLGDKILILS